MVPIALGVAPVGPSCAVGVDLETVEAGQERIARVESFSRELDHMSGMQQPSEPRAVGGHRRFEEDETSSISHVLRQQHRSARNTIDKEHIRRLRSDKRLGEFSGDGSKLRKLAAAFRTPELESVGSVPDFVDDHRRREVGSENQRPARDTRPRKVGLQMIASGIVAVLGGYR